MRNAIAFNVLLLAVFSSAAFAQTASSPRSSHPDASDSQSRDTFSSAAEAELSKAIDLTHRGLFSDAIPHFLAADGHVADERALRFNLALCYVATAQFPKAIPILNLLKSSGYDNENVENLLAQAYIGNGQSQQAFQALQRAVSFSPDSEKLYAFVADACADRQDYELGLRVVELGLQHLPNSARLHYQRGYFLVLMNHWDPARPEFDLAASLAPHSDIAYLAEAQKFKFAGDPQSEIRVIREAVKDGHANYLALAMLGDALIAAGAAPGQPEFDEAKASLTRAIEERPQFAGAHLSLGSLLLMENNLPAAIQHLETAKTFAPANPTVYSRLAVAYRKAGNKPAADAALASLAELNAQLVEKIRTAPGDRKPIMSGDNASSSQP
jgi:tetratricopeptide (TPR) repeat protein